MYSLKIDSKVNFQNVLDLDCQATVVGFSLIVQASTVILHVKQQPVHHALKEPRTQASKIATSQLVWYQIETNKNQISVSTENHYIMQLHLTVYKY